MGGDTQGARLNLKRWRPREHGQPTVRGKAKEFGVTVAMVGVIKSLTNLRNQSLETEKLKVSVATVLPLEEVKKAHQISASGHANGKIILRP